jgi:hypothetical protein
VGNELGFGCGVCGRWGIICLLVNRASTGLPFTIGPDYATLCAAEQLMYGPTHQARLKRWASVWATGPQAFLTSIFIVVGSN